MPVSTKGLWALALLGVGIVGGIGAYVKLTPGAKIPVAEHRDTDKKKPTPDVNVRSHEDLSQVAVYAPKFSDAGELDFTSHRLDVPKGEDARVYAVNMFLKETGIALPTAKLMSIDVHDGTAVLSFNADFYKGGYGTDDERAMIGGLQRVLGQFKEIQTLDFRKDGEKAETLGNIDLEGMKVER